MNFHKLFSSTFVCLAILLSGYSAIGQQSCRNILDGSDKFRQAVEQCGGACYIETTHVIYENYVSRNQNEQRALSRVQSYFHELMYQLSKSSLRELVGESRLSSVYYQHVGRLFGFSYSRMARIVNGGDISRPNIKQVMNFFSGKKNQDVPYTGFQEYDNSKQYSMPYAFKTADFVKSENEMIFQIAIEFEKSLQKLRDSRENHSEIEIFNFIKHALEMKIRDLLSRSQVHFSEIEVPLKNIGRTKRTVDPSGRLISESSTALKNFLVLDATKITDLEIANMVESGFVVGLGFRLGLQDEILFRNTVLPISDYFKRVSGLDLGNLLFRGGHGVVIIDFQKNSSGKVTHWLALNSWGNDYGKNGHFRIPVNEIRARKQTEFHILDPLVGPVMDPDVALERLMIKNKKAGY